MNHDLGRVRQRLGDRRAEGGDARLDRRLAQRERRGGRQPGVEEAEPERDRPGHLPLHGTAVTVGHLEKSAQPAEGLVVEIGARATASSAGPPLHELHAAPVADGHAWKTGDRLAEHRFPRRAHRERRDRRAVPGCTAG